MYVKVLYIVKVYMEIKKQQKKNVICVLPLKLATN